MNCQNPKEFQAKESILYDSEMVATHHCTFVQTHWMYNTKSNPNAKYEHWVIMMCQCGFISYNEHTAVVAEAVWWGEGGWIRVIQEILNLLLKFAVSQSKTALEM